MTLVLAFTGDVYAAPHTLDLCDADPSHLATACSALARADLRFANLEAPLLDAGRPLFSTGVRLRSPTRTVQMLRRLGIGIVTLANNHLMDYGPAGMFSTLASLDRAGIAHVGAGRDLAAAREPVVLEVRDQRIGFLGVCDDQGGGAGPAMPGVCLLDPRHLVPAVRRLQRQADHVVVGIHTGIEFVATPEPFFLDLARQLVDAGASVVVGHHPHVPQGVLRYGKGLIACSLGDFLFDLPHDAAHMTAHQRRFNGLHPVLEVELDRAGVVGHRVHWLHRDGTGEFHPVSAEADPTEAFADLCRLAEDENRLTGAARAVYRAELYQTLYTVYAAVYLAVRRGQSDLLRGLPWWLATFRRKPKRRFVGQGLAATCHWALDRLRGGTRA